MKKVLIVSQYFCHEEDGKIIFPGGTERYAYGISKELRKIYKIKILTFTNNKNLQKIKKINGMDIKYVYVKSNKINHILRDFYSFKEVNKELAKKYDFVHIIGCGYHFAAGAALACIANKTKTAYTAELASYHENKNFFSNFLDSIITNKILNKINLIISPSEETKDMLKKELNEKLIKVLPNFIEKTFYIKNKKIKNSLIFVGRFEPKQKGIWTLLEAMKLCVKKIPSLKLIMCGDTDNLKVKNEILKRIKNYGLEKNIKLPGKVNEKELKHYFSISQVFVIPSNYEALSIAFVEALSARLPTISSNIKSFLEVTDYGKYGIHFKKDDAADLSEKICKIMKNESMIKEYSELSNKRYKKYLLKNTIKDLKKEYAKILD
ncbi:MAG: glycosyltransferase family 4 protein [Candidatus Nanoarchaeia archaeon]|nr:glycosyltransferase family 4 protein [Candidatus Nanoarchaeia archaeon]